MIKLMAIILLAVLSASAVAAVDPVPPWPTPVQLAPVGTWPAMPALTPAVTASIAPPSLTAAVTASTAPPTLAPAFTASSAPPSLAPAITASTAPPTLTATVTASSAPPVLSNEVFATVEPPSLLALLTASTLPPQIAFASIFTGGVEQQAVLAGTLTLATLQLAPPAVPVWLDGWYFPTWRGQSTADLATTQSGMPLTWWSEVSSFPPPATPHLVAVVSDATTPLTSLAAYLVADSQAVAVIIGWEATDHSYQPNATLDALRLQAVALAVRTARPGLPVWFLASATVTGNQQQAAAVIAAAGPDALVVYGYFSPPAWEPATLTANLARAQALLPGKPVYAAGLRFYGAAREQALLRAQQTGWSGVIREVR
jgi:hypothetical protein